MKQLKTIYAVATFMGCALLPDAMMIICKISGR